MRQFIRLLLIPGVLGWLLGGCTEKIEPHPTTYSQLLTGTDKKTWKMVSIQVFDNGQGSGVIPAQSAVASCIADDLLTFYADAEHKLEASEGATKCNPQDPDIYVTDNWNLVNATATLEFYIPAVNAKVPWTLKNLTDRTFTVEYYFPDIDASYRFTFNPVQ
ncbi:hypothetical protein WBJ53_04560 [Spirosoma sp. SC4-14]|uniref:hypothetical protein n=1 Tax=Spirosoma sp. SC4-14 TaxID=3128900 RepID=UPI0030CEF9B5